MKRLLPFIIIIAVVVVVVVIAVVLLGQQPTTQQQADEPGGVAQPIQPPSRNNNDEPVPTIEPIETIRVAYVTQEIPRGLEITRELVAIADFPVEDVFDIAYAVPEEEAFPDFTQAELDETFLEENILGRRARTLIPRAQYLTPDMLVVSLNDVDFGGDAAALMDPDEVAIAVPMDRVTSVAYAIQPGDFVDVIVSLLFVDVDPTFQSLEPNAFSSVSIRPTEDGGLEIETDDTVIRGAFDTRFLPRGGEIPVIISPSEQQRPRLVTQRTVQRARVVGVGDFPEDGRIVEDAEADDESAPDQAAAQQPPADPNAQATPTPQPDRPDIITLAVSPQEAVVLTWMVEARVPITFALRAAQNQSLAQTSAVTLDYVMGQYRINLPDKFSYSIQPAIRSIRQLDVGDRIQLEDAEDNQGN